MTLRIKAQNRGNQHFNTRLNEINHYETQSIDNQHNDTGLMKLYILRLSIMTLSIMKLSITTIRIRTVSILTLD
jgi:hypothetical protein